MGYVVVISLCFIKCILVEYTNNIPNILQVWQWNNIFNVVVKSLFIMSFNSSVILNNILTDLAVKNAWRILHIFKIEKNAICLYHRTNENKNIEHYENI